MDKRIFESAGQVLLQAQRILITSHKRPDGDAIGSVLGLGLALQNAGKEVQMTLADGLPSAYRFLAGSDQISKKPEGNFDATVMVDCSDLERAGRGMVTDQIPTLNIDHHITNENFAEINLVITSATSTTEILWDCLAAWGIPVTLPVAEALFTGLITDTLGFRTSNMTAKALRLAADLVDFGCDLPRLYQEVLLNRSYEAWRYWGFGLNTLQLENRLVWAELTLGARKSAGYPGRDDADLINALSSISEADVAVLFVEQNNGTVKVSWRARTGFDVSQIAVHFGGGGHKAASGAEIQGDLDHVKTEVLNNTRQILAGNTDHTLIKS